MSGIKSEIFSTILDLKLDKHLTIQREINSI